MTHSLVCYWLSFVKSIHVSTFQDSDDRCKDNQENKSSSDDDDDYNNFGWEFDQQLATSQQVIYMYKTMIAAHYFLSYRIENSIFL